MNTLLRRCVVSAGLAVLCCCTEIASAQDTTAQIWRELGPGSASGDGISNETLGDSGPPSVVIDQITGQIYVAWESGNSEIYVRKWTGTEWVEVGVGGASGAGISNTKGKSRFPSVALGPDRQPVVAWLDDTSGNWEVYLKRFGAATNSWTGIAGSAEGAGLSRALGAIASPDGVLPSVAVGTNGQLYVAWGTNKTEKHVIVSSLASTGWSTLGPSVDNPDEEYGPGLTEVFTPEYRGAAQPSLALTADNVPVVAYITQSSTSSGDVHVRRWSNGAWQPFGAGAASHRGISDIGPHAAGRYVLSSPRLVFSNSGVAHVGWLYSDQEQKLIHLRRLDGTAWVNAGPSLSVPLAKADGGLSLGFTLDNAPLVAWAEDLPILAPIGNVEIYVSKLTRTNNTNELAWQEYGAGSASGAGVSSRPGDSLYPFLAFARPSPLAVVPIGGAGTVLAWLDTGDFTNTQVAQVYVRRAQPASTLVEFSQPTYLVTENAGQAEITVQRRGVLNVETRVRYATDGGTATPGTDYTAVSGDLVFAPGETTKTFLVPVKLDDVAEEKETVGLLLLNPSPGSDLGTVRAATLGIVDSITPPPPRGRLQFKLDRYEVNEGGGRAVIEVVRVDGSAGEVGVHYETLPLNVANGDALVAGAALPNLDYTPVSGTLTFGDGVTSRIFEVPILEDTLVEGNELLGLRLREPTGGATLGTANALLTIVDNDIAPPISTIQFNPSEYHVAENAGSVELRVTRTGDTTTPASVDYFTPEVSVALVGVATPGADFEITSGTLNFAPGESEKKFSVAIKPDNLPEGNETFSVGLRNAHGAILGNPSNARVVIEEIAPPPQAGVIGFATGEFRIGEGEAQASITVIRREGSDGEVSVRYATSLPPFSEHAATPGEDYTATNGTLTFAAGETSKTFTVPILEDALVEGAEFILLSLSDPTGGAKINPDASKASLIISDNDQPPGQIQFELGEVRVREGAGSVSLIVVRREGGAGEVTVDYKTADGTAKAGSDYSEASGTLTFAPGQLSRAITIPIAKDGDSEDLETFTVALSNPTGGATLGSPNVATVGIIDSEPAGVIQFARTEYLTSERSGSVIITVVRTEGTEGVVTVDYSTRDGTARAGLDYTAASGTLKFAPWEKSKSFPVRILEDKEQEGPETFSVLLSSPTGGAVLGTRNMTWVTIGDNEIAARLQFMSSDYRVRENGAAGFALITVIRRGAINRAVSIKYSSADGTATAGEDYTAVSGTLEFAPRQVFKIFRIPISRDSKPEGTETVLLTLRDPEGAILGSPSTATLTIADPEVRNGSVQFASSQFIVNEAAGPATITVTRKGTTGAITVKYAAIAGTATETDDFTPVSGTLTFENGEAKKTFTVPITVDNLAEPVETVRLELSNPTGGALLGTPAHATLTILEARIEAGL